MKLILKKSGGIFDIGNLKNEISELEKKTFEADFWNTDKILVQRKNCLKSMIS